MAHGAWRPALVGGLVLAGCAPSAPRPRSLVLVLVDTLRRDHVSAYGYGRLTTPFFDRLAGEGALLDGLSPASWTQPATASLLTGLHPVRHQSVRREALPAEASTLAERLGARGYRTLAVSANPLVSGDWGLAQGFGELVQLDGNDGKFSVDAGSVNEAVRARLSRLRPPFFLYVHYVDPHAPYGPGIGWDGGPLPERLRGRGPMQVGELDADKFTARPRGLLQDAIDLYDGEIRQADEGLGQLLDALARAGLMHGTVTVVTADHGEELEDHGRMLHARTLYEEILRVPLAFHAPGLVAPGVRHGSASLMDVLPTALALLDVDAGDGLDGVDLSRWLREGRSYEPGDRDFLAHHDMGEASGLALRRGRHKLLLGRVPHRKELFDLESDPSERSNRLSAEADRVRRLARRLAAAHNEAAARALPPAPRPRPRQREALAALGYLGTGESDGRAIPPVVREARAEDDGLVGWEDLAELSRCVVTHERQNGQLLDGWHAPELGGRWTLPAATALLRSEAGPSRARLRGVNHESRRVSFRVFLDGVQVAAPAVPPGPFEVKAPARPRAAGASVLRIERPEPLVPALVGLHDDRLLGVFLSSVCLEPATP